jgi:hypothetical protein
MAEKTEKFDQKAMDRITDRVLAYRPKGKGKSEEKPEKATPSQDRAQV